MLYGQKTSTSFNVSHFDTSKTQFSLLCVQQIAVKQHMTLLFKLVVYVFNRNNILRNLKKTCCKIYLGQIL